MSTAYTPGLTITASTIIRKTRRLPLKGTVLVQVGEKVEPETVIARTELPGPVTNIRAAERLGIEPGELRHHLKVREGDHVTPGDVIGEVQTFFGLFTSCVHAPVTGSIEFISDVTGNVGIRHDPAPVELNAYISGTIAEVLENEGAVVETEGSLVQGIFGIGGERQGVLQVLAESPEEVVAARRIDANSRDRVLILGGQVTLDTLQAAVAHGAAGVVASCMVDEDLRRILGYDIGVAVTGRENVSLTVILTEGFGNLPMASNTFTLLRSLAGMSASINGATQIRAGVIRPEVIVPHVGVAESKATTFATDLEIGTPIRLIRAPYFGALATVSALPVEPERIETGAVVRILRARLRDGTEVTVPRANVEILATGCETIHKEI